MKNAKIESNGCRMEVVQDYAGVTLYFDGDYSPPSSERRPTEDEFHEAHGVITKHLNSVGKATENPDEYKGADFTLNRHFDPRAAINVVSDLARGQRSFRTTDSTPKFNDEQAAPSDGNKPSN